MAQTIITNENSILTQDNWKDKIKRIGATKQSIYERTGIMLAKKYDFQLVIINPLKNYEDLIREGEIDAYIGDSNIPWFSKNRKKLYYIKEAPVTHYGIMYPKGSGLRNKLDPYVQYFLKSPSYYKLVRKYLVKDANLYFRKLSLLDKFYK